MAFIDFFRRDKNGSQAVTLKQANQMLMSGLMRMSALNSERYGTDPSSDRRLMVSLTTFSKRIDDVYICIESLLQQTLRPNKLVLWLSREEFSEDDIPASLRLQMKRGLEIKFCERDIGPYKKIIPALLEFPDYKIITVDDDVIYPVDLVDKLYRSYQSDPTVIHAFHAHQISLDASGNLLPYKQWQRPTLEIQPSLFTYPVGIGGVIYFPGCFAEDVTNEERFLTLAPMADDIWLKAMSLLIGVKCRKINDERSWDSRYIMIEGSQKYALKRKNKLPLEGNDHKLANVFKDYQLKTCLGI